MHINFFVSFIFFRRCTCYGKESNSKIEWKSQLSQEFINSQKALDTAETITLPIAKDQLIITADASCQAISATMFIQRGKTQSNLLYGPLPWMGSTASRLQSHFEEAVYFLPLSSQKLLVLIWLTTEKLKSDSTFEQSSGFEHRTSRLVIQQLNH